MAHGGKVLMVADRTAAILVRELLRNTGLVGLTVGVTDCQFYRGPLCGEVITVVASVESFGTSRITTYIQMLDEKDKKVFDGYVSFCSFTISNINNKPELKPHGLKITK